MKKNKKLDDKTTVIPDLRGKSYFGLFLLLGILLLLLSAAASISFGSASMKLTTAWTAIFKFDPELTEHQIIHALRIPRTAADIIAGMCLAVAGAVMQGSTRNPLADSGLMGVNAGAALAMAVTLAFLPGQLQTTTLLVSFIGAGIGAGLTYLAASLNRSGMTPQRLVLAGISLTMLFGALGSFISLNYGIGRALAYWTSGSVAGATWEEIQLVIPWFLGGLALSLFISRSITVLNLGEDIAKGFGQRIVLVKTIAVLAVLLLAGVAVALVGPIGFVGLIVPHMMRFFVGVDYRYIIPVSAIYGGTLMVVADIAGRLINRPAETALGIIFAMIGVPFFLLIASREEGLQMNVVKSYKATIWIPSLFILLIAVAILSVNMGKVSLNPLEVLQVLLGQSSDEHNLVVFKFRLPRIVLAILVGFGMALAGAVMQALLRNDLADPGMLGISSGSGLMVLLIISTVSIQGAAITLLLPSMAFVGGLLAAVLIYVIAYRKRRMISSTRLVLTGVAINMGLSALSLFLTLKLDDQKYEFAQRWQAGYLWGDKWSYIIILAPWVLLLFAYIYANFRTLNILVLGNEISIGLGVAVKRKFLRLAIAAVGIASGCVALGGSIFFIGLISPHVARKLVGQDYKVLLPASALIGGILLLAADTIARTVSFKTEIPAGIIVTMLSVPYFLYLLMRSK